MKPSHWMEPPPAEKLVLVTRKTRLEALVGRFNTLSQAKFYVEHAGADFSDYEAEHATYHGTLERLRRDVAGVLKVHEIDRSYLPNYLFTKHDLVMTVGQDGLVVNTAKYLDGQPLIAVNPDPARFDGVLLPFLWADAAGAVRTLLDRGAPFESITMAEAALADGQRLLAFNDLFIGARSHVSARYVISFQGKEEVHSSSGVIVSTGAGSSGWLSSLYNMARGMLPLVAPGSPGLTRAGHGGSKAGSRARKGLPETDRGDPGFPWDANRLRFVVREPFRSRASQAELVTGEIEPESPLLLESRMPEEGVIFSDGVEADYLAFGSGARVTIRLSEKKTRLIVQSPGPGRRNPGSTNVATRTSTQRRSS